MVWDDKNKILKMWLGDDCFAKGMIDNIWTLNNNSYSFKICVGEKMRYGELETFVTQLISFGGLLVCTLNEA